MNQLVFVESNRVVTDSLTVADVFGKDHKNVIRDIENQMEKLSEAGEMEWGSLNFELGSYQHVQNKQIFKKYNLTEEAFTIVAMSYVTPEAMKMKVKFIQEFKRMREKLSEPKRLTEKEQLIAAMRLSIESAEEIAAVKEEVAEIKHTLTEQLTLDHGQQVTLHHAIKKRVESIKGDYDITTNKLYNQIHSHLRRAFAAPKYIFVKRKDYEEALAWVKTWRPLI